MKISGFGLAMLTAALCLSPYANAYTWTDVLEIVCDTDRNSLTVKELRTNREGLTPEDKANVWVKKHEGLEYKEAGPRGMHNIPAEETIEKVMGRCSIGYGKYDHETQKLSQVYDVIIRRVSADPVTLGKCGAAAGVNMEIAVDGDRVAYWPSTKNLCLEGVSAPVFDGQAPSRSFRIGHGTSPFEMGIQTCGENSQTRESYPQSGSESYIEMQVNLTQCRSGTINGFKVWEAGRAERLEERIASAEGAVDSE